MEEIKKVECSIPIKIVADKNISYRNIGAFRNLANKNANWIFGIDGLPKDSHKYRKNQDGEFLFDMMLLNKYLGMRPEWQYIVFDYNKDDIEEAKKIAKRHELKFMLITSKRPVSKDIHNVELKEVKDGKLGWTKSSKKTDGENPNNSYASIDYSTGDWTKRPTSKVEDKKIKANTLKPKCLLTDRDLSYSVTGHILPCCWVNTSFNDRHIKSLLKDKLKIENNNSIEEILDKKEWKELYKFSEETFVEEDEKSKLNSAGAGLIDND